MKEKRRERPLSGFKQAPQHSEGQAPGPGQTGFIESLALFKRAFDTMQIGITISDVDGKILYINPAEAQMHGYGVEELLGRDVRIFAPSRLWSPLTLPKVHSLQRWKRESINLRKDGSTFPVQLMSDVFRDGEGKIIGIITTCEDITERRELAERLTVSEEKYRSLVDSTDDSIYLVDGQYRYLFMNKKHLSRIGVSEGEYIGRLYHEFHSAEETQSFLAKVNEVFSTGGSVQDEYHSSRDDRFFLQTFSPIRDEDGNIVAITVVSKDITEHRKTEEQVSWLAYYDSLTSLPNRYFFKDILDKALAQASRHKRMLAILFLDLDNFKRINDGLGHNIGDELLQAVAARLLRSVRTSDSIVRTEEHARIETLSRLGGDEFIILLPEITRREDAAIVARRILGEISEPYILGGNRVIVTFSIGISIYPSNGEDVQSLLKCADMAMYDAKDKGKNNYQFYTESMQESVFERLTLESDLNRALEKNEFEIYYQATLDAPSRTIVGMEALLRWRHPEKGLISPSVFIPWAEETGLVIPIDEWVLHAACLRNKAFQEAGFPSVVIAVNLSTTHFESRKLTKTVTQALRSTGLDPQYLELEITEGKIMKNPVTTIAVLNELKAIGVRIAIDDFGTGHSSLSYLGQLPLDYVKIDRSFVMNITKSHHDTVIIKSIIALAHSLNFKVIAEGVETEEQLAFLLEHECDMIQGYLFSKPLPENDFLKLLKGRGLV